MEDEFDINLNQNLWGNLLGGLIVSYMALGAAEYWSLKWLFWLSAVTSFGMTASVLATAAFYTVNYCRRKRRDGSNPSS
jgi:hypothetical protein